MKIEQVKSSIEGLKSNYDLIKQVKLENGKSLIEENRNLFAKYDKNKNELLATLEDIEKDKNEISDQLGSIFSRNFLEMPLSSRISREYAENFLKTKINQFKQYKYLLLLDSSKNSIIVGANGSGKSSFADFFKKTENSGIIVIPARKYLYCQKEPNYEILKVNKLEIQEDMEEANTKTIYSKKFYNKPEYEFSRIIAAISNEFFNYLKDHEKDDDRNEVYDNNIFHKFQKIYSILFPDISISDPDAISRSFYPVKNGQKYSIDQMSEGEKVAIYYIIKVLLADDDGIIIVDEPDVYLNAAIYNRLWNILEKEKERCRFIYISHRVDFIESRNNVNLIWCKKFIYPDYWDLKQLELGEEEFPNELLLELSGIKKSVIFCEGAKHSDDYKIYSAMFPEYNVVPIGTCKDVIDNTKNYNNKQKFFCGEAYGIIDNDLRTKENRKSLAIKNVFVTDYLEIEMLLCDEDVFKAVIRGEYPSYSDNKLQDKFNEFRDKFVDTMDKNKSEVVDRWRKKLYEQILNNKIYDTKKDMDSNIESLNSELNNLKNKLSLEFEGKLNKILQEKEYSGLLKYCTLQHGMIVDAIGNSVATGDYRNKALSHIISNEELLDNLRKKYFSQFLKVIKN
ncbi:DUF4435 domain-containing protein [Lactobacillus sp. ESL0680]|uniref:DUF4435 domain-containing protein n=1 Tax=Lactobacillus sp. ESL0680 TaxID=2983210 RepID=UPI0023F8FD96|nr:DUF4435 domain-containing protein [Lactobacillus sp. ESL0680]WEV39067.1 DUF4435 domain-containing protein [Lactobacillus sp. ESL0680]